MDSKVIGANLLRYREAKGLTQSQMAKTAGISRLAYRKIEIGESMPRVSTLQDIADGIGVKIQDLFIPIRTLKNVRFRAFKRMNNRSHILAEVGRWLDDYHHLEKVLDNQVPYLFRGFNEQLLEVPPEDRPKRAAEEARKKLGLDLKGPILDIAGLLELSGIKLYPITISSDGFFGMSVSEADGGPAIVINIWERISVERWIFSAAHELGHLLLHLDSYNVEVSEEDSSQEIEANVFASYFLMPQATFDWEWDETSGLLFLDRVMKIKRIFQVSYKTILYRLSERGDDSVWRKFHYYYKKRTGRSLSGTEEPAALTPNKFQLHMPEGLRSREPDSLLSSDFMEDRLSRLVRDAIEQEEITIGRGAEILRLNLADMRERVASWE